MLPLYGKDVAHEEKDKMATELLDFAARQCAPEVYEALLNPLAEHGDDDIDSDRLPAPGT